MRPMRPAFGALLLLLSTAASAQTIYTWVDETGTVHYTDTLSSVPEGVKVDTTVGAELAIVQVESDKEEGQVVEKPRAAASAPAPQRGSGWVSAITGEPLDEYAWRGRFRAAHAEVQNLEDELAMDKKRINESASYGYGPGILCGPGYLAPGAAPQAYRAVDPLAAMQARATIRPAPGVTITGDAQVRTAPVPPAGYAGYAHRGYGASCIATPSPDYERLRDRIERNTQALKRAQEALGDLERQASHHGVPREWRKP